MRTHLNLNQVVQIRKCCLRNGKMETKTIILLGFLQHDAAQKDTKPFHHNCFEPIFDCLSNPTGSYHCALGINCNILTSKLYFVFLSHSKASAKIKQLIRFKLYLIGQSDCRENKKQEIHCEYTKLQIFPSNLD